MAAGKYDFSIEQGTSFKLSLIYKDASGNPIDITGWCSRLVWKTNTNITQIYTSENTDYSIYKFIIDGNAGKLTLLIPASATNSFNFKTAKYDLELQSPEDLYSGGGKYTTRILFGTINIIKRFSSNNSNIECT